MTWVMIVSVVLMLVLAAIMMLITYNHNASIKDRTTTQAYYTAQSVNERIVSWLTGTPQEKPVLTSANRDYYYGVIKQWEFIEELKENGPIREEYDEENLGSNMGTAVTTVSFTTEAMDVISIITEATYAENTEKLETKLYLKKTTDFNYIGTGFDYTAPEISEIYIEVSFLYNLEDNQIDLQKLYVGNVDDENGFWSTGLNVLTDGATNYRMDLLAVPSTDLLAGGDTVAHDYSYRYLLDNSYNIQNPTAKEILAINLDPSRGAFMLTQTGDNDPSKITDVSVNSEDNPPLDNFPYSIDDKKGVLLLAEPSTQPYSFLNNKLILYTLDYNKTTNSNNDIDWPDITLGPGMIAGSTKPAANSPLTYQNLHMYITDTSESKLTISRGLRINSGVIYTTRNTEIGAEVSDVENTAIGEYTKYDWLTLGTDASSVVLIFANPGDDEQRRHSAIRGYYNEAEYVDIETKLNNGSIVIQSNHTLTIESNTIINAQDNKGIVVEPGGELIINEGTEITGNIYVANGATLTINGNTKITGNIFAAGTVNINSSFTINPLDTNKENIKMGFVSNSTNPTNATGIFIYGDEYSGIGTLNLLNNGVGLEISGNSNRVHTFVPCPDALITSNIFCSHAHGAGNVCEGWHTEKYIWSPTAEGTQQVRN